MIDALVALGVFVAAFLLGSIPWGLIISKVFYHTDIREHGSGNIGTTNAMRTMGKKGGRGIPARFRQGHRVGLHWHGRGVSFDGQLREL